MIRSIIAAILIIGSLAIMLAGGHPVWGITSTTLGLILVAWVCVNKFEDVPQLSN